MATLVGTDNPLGNLLQHLLPDVEHKVEWGHLQDPDLAQYNLRNDCTKLYIVGLPEYDPELLFRKLLHDEQENNALLVVFFSTTDVYDHAHPGQMETIAHVSTSPHACKFLTFERLVQETCAKHLVIRLPQVFGAGMPLHVVGSNPHSMMQYYCVEDMYDDLFILEKRGCIGVFNFVSEPILAANIAADVLKPGEYGFDFAATAPSEPLPDVQTMHAILFGQSKPYVRSLEYIMDRVRACMKLIRCNGPPSDVVVSGKLIPLQWRPKALEYMKMLGLRQVSVSFNDLSEWKCLTLYDMDALRSSYNGVEIAVLEDVFSRTSRTCNAFSNRSNFMHHFKKIIDYAQCIRCGTVLYDEGTTRNMERLVVRKHWDALASSLHPEFLQVMRAVCVKNNGVRVAIQGCPDSNYITNQNEAELVATGVGVDGCRSVSLDGNMHSTTGLVVVDLAVDAPILSVLPGVPVLIRHSAHINTFSSFVKLAIDIAGMDRDG